jgi:hypothetical protein
MDKLLQIHAADNVYVAREPVAAGEVLLPAGVAIVVRDRIELGQKMAARDILCGEKIIKFGVPIGSATMDIPAGTHIHLHNMQSDHLPTYTLENEFIKKK